MIWRRQEKPKGRGQKTAKPPAHGCNSSGSLAIFAAIRRASSLGAERRLLVPAILAAVLTVFDGSAALVQRRQAETSHLFEDNIGLTATVVRLIGIMAIDNGTVV